MSNYCDFNPNLFKQFISMKKTIIPAMADDWKIIPTQYRNKDGFGLESIKLGYTVQDIKLRKFLRFCSEQNLTITGNKLIGEYIVGNDRAVYTKEMFEIWKTKFESRTKTIISQNEYQIGHKYLTPCGMEIVYLGFRYISKLKNYPQDLVTKTKVTKKHFVKLYNRAEILTQKFTKDLGQEITKSEADELLKKYYHNNFTIVYFDTNKMLNPRYGIIPTNMPKIKYTNNQQEECWYYQQALLVEIKKGDIIKPHNSHGFSIDKQNKIRSNFHVMIINKNDLSHPPKNTRIYTDEIPVYNTYRIGVI